MNDKLKHIFDSEEHIDESTLWLYSKGELPHDEMHRVEKHLIDCPMCSDVVEGFSLYESEGGFNASLNRVSEAFFSAKRGISKQFIKIMTIAASFILVAGIGFVLVQQFQKTEKAIPKIAEQKRVKTQDTTVNDIIKLHEEIDEIALADQEEMETLSIPENITNSEKNTKREEPQIVMELNVVEDDAEFVIEEENIEIESEEPVSSEVNDIEQSILSESDNDKMLKSSNFIEKENTVVSESVTMRNSASGNNLDFEQIYNQGLSLMKNEAFSDAVSQFRRIPNNNFNYWNAQWNIAKCYVQLGDTQKAKQQYELLQHPDSPYRISAKDILDDVE